MAQKPKPFTPLTHDECYRLIGEFMYHWMQVEGALNTAAVAALDLDVLPGLIVACNVQFRDKSHVVSTAISISHMPVERREHYTRLIEHITNMNNKKRNTVAHNRFMPAENKRGVEFIIARAKGVIEFDNLIWTENDFTVMKSRMIEFYDQLCTLEKDIVKHRNVRLLARALSQPTSGLASLGFPSFLGLPPLDAPGFGLLGATPRTEDENRPSTLD